MLRFIDFVVRCSDVACTDVDAQDEEVREERVHTPTINSHDYFDNSCHCYYSSENSRQLLFIDFVAMQFDVGYLDLDAHDTPEEEPQDKRVHLPAIDAYDYFEI